MENNINSIVSTAFNFGEQFSSDVDLRTGTFNFSIIFGHLNAAGIGKIQLQLSYNMMSNEDLGFGKGWSLNHSRYHKASNRLSLSDGRSFYIEINSYENKVSARYLKEKDVQIDYVNKLIRITYKNGVIEHLDRDGYLSKVVHPSGHRVHYEYQMNNVLKSIKDSAGKELEIVYSKYRATTVGSDGQTQVTLDKSVNRIQLITFGEEQSINLTYQNLHSLHVIKSVKYSSGMEETLQYSNTGTRLPNGGPVEYLPAVEYHITTGSDLKKMKKSYSYSAKNFLGSGLANYKVGYDSLIETREDYEYWSTETSPGKTIKQTFNKYHQMINEELTDSDTNNVMQETVITYYSDTKIKFDEQPAQYLREKETNTTFYDNNVSRCETLKTDYDIYNNLTLARDAYGIAESYEYYTPQELDSPSPFPFYVKEKTVSSWSTYTPEGTIIPTNETLYTYLPFPSLTDGKTFLLLDVQRKLMSGKEVEKQKMTYVDQVSNPELHSQLEKEDVTTAAAESIIDYQYDLTDDHLTINKTTTFIDTNPMRKPIGPFNASSTLSLHHGFEVGTKDELGATVSYKYDLLGRVKKEVYSANTKYEITKLYDYLSDKNKLHITISDQTKERYEFDSRGNEIEYYATDSSGKLKHIRSKEYNAQALLETESIYDDFGEGEVKISNVYTYNIWDEVTETQRPTGVIEAVNRNKAENSETNYLKSGTDKICKVKTYFNEQGEPIEIEYPDYTIKNTYDGFGRLINTIDPNSIKTSYTLDDLGRRKQITTAGTPKLEVKNEFDPYSNEERVTVFKVNDVVIGKRDFDVLGRVVEESKSDKPTHFEYSGANQKPTKVTQPDGSSTTFELYSIPDMIKSSTASDGAFNEFKYNHRGQATFSKNALIEITKEYYTNGQLKSQSQWDRTASYDTYSRQGKLIKCVDFFGVEEIKNYDEYHRLSSIEVGNVKVVLGYDKFDRVEYETISSQLSYDIENSYTYDNFSRLKRKETKIDNNPYINQGYEYKNDGKLDKKTIVDLSGHELSSLTESYEYDDYGRMINYNVTGVSGPNYKDVGRIISQIFTFDCFNNIESVDTSFITDNGSLKSDKAVYTYDKNQLLEEVAHSYEGIADYTISYDVNGNQLIDEQNRQYKYNSQGQLIGILDANDEKLTDYKYSAGNSLIEQSVIGQEDIKLYYSQYSGLLHEQQGNSHTRLLKVNNSPLIRFVHHNDEIKEQILITDCKGSCINEISTNENKSHIYSPYGSR
ncbi:RHS repeat protein [Moritella sp. 28]|uniref:RHS repeat protein n=1 Tax=Moritella sp. 28 TaxID=2746232 RepID=UPI001BA9F819|nr:RHS repeat protein [Moritella sp. 28]QUM86840.1 RHS repeat protein [Moritella sp. 28]